MTCVGGEKEMAADGTTFARRRPLFKINTRQQIGVILIGGFDDELTCMDAEKKMAADGATFGRRRPLFKISTRQQIRVISFG